MGTTFPPIEPTERIYEWANSSDDRNAFTNEGTKMDLLSQRREVHSVAQKNILFV